MADGSLCQGGNLKVKLLGFNDFHGQISAGKTVSSRPVGGAGASTALSDISVSIRYGCATSQQDEFVEVTLSAAAETLATTGP